MSQANSFDLSDYTLPTTFPDHDSCFGSANTSSICQIPSAAMIAFLNITDPGSYLDTYCLDPPADSCAFGYCPNPDVASPAVRFSAYFTALVSALLVLYSPEDVENSFFAQLLNVYSLIIAAMVAISKHNLTKLHSVISLTLASSPLSLYLLAYVIRSLFGKPTRLDKVFGKEKLWNRAIVLFMLPLWAAVLSFTAMPTSVWHFQQAACDSVIADNSIVSLFFLPFIVFFYVYPEIGGTFLGLFLLAWGTCIYRLRKTIWAKKNRRFPLGRLWRKTVQHYPFLQFCTVILFPHFIWIFNIEIGLRFLSNRESFEATYGQLLAIFVTIPPFISLCRLLPRVPRWFVDLTWVRYLTCRRRKSRRNDNESLDDGIPLKGGSGMEARQYEFDTLQSTDTKYTSVSLGEST
ncbi:hypothetical protein R3P38DRAFT_3088997 [Favolaschia claudopus]|uniref:Uncharacterized protein n=1 Tax=Favolaschia claudopus TaxID=2862362 RepID=A0AAV9ZSY5_9AGAR